MKYKIITLYIVLMFSRKEIHAQIRSIPDSIETKHLIQEVLNLGCRVEKCDSTDRVCLFNNFIDKKAYEELKDPYTHIVRMFSPIIKDTIKSYDFYKHFDQYFSVDTNSYSMYFFKWNKGKNEVFGTSQHETNKSGSVSYTQVIAISIKGMENTFLNVRENGNSTLLFPMSFDVSMFVNNNHIYVIVDNEVVDSDSYFRKYSLEVLNSFFKGVQKNMPVN